MNRSYGTELSGKSSMNSSGTKFKEITNIGDLIHYLCDANSRLDNTGHLFHYTTLGTCINILKTKQWHLANAKDSNDLLEYESGDKETWKNIFQSSYMIENKENMGMWSMYAQPWFQGVKISVPKGDLIDWMKSVELVTEISRETMEATGRVLKTDEFFVDLAAVVYYDYGNVASESDYGVLRYSNQPNKNINNAISNPKLTGFIKSSAWSYEKEIRLRVLTRNYSGFERVAIDIPDHIINALTFTASPRFEGNLKDQLFTGSGVHCKTNNSQFAGKLQLKPICDKCEYKKTATKWS